MATYKNHNVKFYAVKKEHYQNGNCPTCKCCGKAIRFVMQIDGDSYGYDCGAKLMNWNETVTKSVQKNVKTFGTEWAINTLVANEKRWEANK